jgi:hypothetical protein
VTKIGQTFVALFFAGRRIYGENVAKFLYSLCEAAEKAMNVLSLYVGV